MYILGVTVAYVVGANFALSIYANGYSNRTSRAKRTSLFPFPLIMIYNSHRRDNLLEPYIDIIMIMRVHNTECNFSPI